MGNHYDLVIVGGGINGCALACAAARRGIRTALVEKNDFGAGVTSRSTRLIHGGLRYLESFQFSLVHECLRDREALLRDHPGQVVPTPFLLSCIPQGHPSAVVHIPWPDAVPAPGLGKRIAAASASQC